MDPSAIPKDSSYYIVIVEALAAKSTTAPQT